MSNETDQPNSSIEATKEERLPAGVTRFEGGTFTAWLAPGLEIVPRERVYPYRGGIALLAERRPDLLDAFRAAEKKEADYTQRGVGLTLDRLGHVIGLDQSAQEYLYRALGAMRGRAVAVADYLRTREAVVGLSDGARDRLNADRGRYLEAMVATTKVSLRNAEWSEGEDGRPRLSCDWAKVPYMAYTVIRDPGLPREILDLASPTATAVIVRTAETPDEPAALAIQIRSKWNRLYKGVPGASAAGMWDARSEKGETVVPTIGEAAANAEKELAEEVGLTSRHVARMTATGFTEDKRSYHTEVTFLADLNVSASQMAEISMNAETGAGQFYGFDFSEAWVFIRSDLTSLETFLTKARVHMPSTHAAAVVAVAVAMKREELLKTGVQTTEVDRQMQEYVEKLQVGVRENYAEVDRMVAEHWVKKQEQDPGFQPKNSTGYDPTLSPEEQGLPVVREELTRLGLVAVDLDKTTREYSIPKEPKFGWVLDVDGVVTDPKEKTASPEVIKMLVEKLAAGEPVAFNTGRSLQFVREKVLRLIEEHLPDRKMLQGLFVVGEKGGTWGYYNEAGEWEEHVNEALVGSDFEVIQEEARRIAQESGGGIIFDESKKTMVTLEMADGGSLEEFAQSQGANSGRLMGRLRTLGLMDTYRVDQTTIAIDVENRAVGGKAEASVLLVNLMASRGIRPQEYIAIGDSPSDADMRVGLEGTGAFAKFVMVGSKELRGDDAVGTVTNPNSYADGALKALRANPILL